ncbi:GNAT family N-acetyltransferase [Actinoplanes regularis]|uniref:Protein N-acetyltransferase, RimJ/RimL family n=1 Tax=Actinoplanes regularis TaxID=52697 RepID=A0A239HFL9_9ACTN|nr:GNAT family protein [Actinoplanes regularis]GIE91030.1 alanine acetyltransferase [Actinoplanes regularis]GLW34273.1 alanine acetyltransferase [Actinoplanes regularis]SNS79945.1 Protein N-acetyltransferase, RimJ/RimL family [Actinoplanes regularis]
MDEQVILRPFREPDLPFLERLGSDPGVTGRYVWAGFRDPRLRRLRWEKDGYVASDSTALAVIGKDPASGQEAVLGIASWEARDRGGPPGGCYEIGLALLPECRGRGLGTTAHQLMVRHLFDCTLAQRLEAQTDADNIAEQRALERVGFSREGVLRNARFREGSWRDMLIYGMLRTGPDI